MYKIIGADGKEYGPVTAEQLRQWMAEGRVNAATRVQAEGSTEWKTIGALPEFAAPPVGLTVSRPSIQNYLVPAILATICCCLPFGIPAIVFAAQVNSKLAAGDVAGAQESSRKAKMWCWIALAAGLASSLFWMLVCGARFHRLHRFQY